MKLPHSFQTLTLLFMVLCLWIQKHLQQFIQSCLGRRNPGGMACRKAPTDMCCKPVPFEGVLGQTWAQMSQHLSCPLQDVERGRSRIAPWGNHATIQQPPCQVNLGPSPGLRRGGLTAFPQLHHSQFHRERFLLFSTPVNTHTRPFPDLQNKLQWQGCHGSSAEKHRWPCWCGAHLRIHCWPADNTWFEIFQAKSSQTLLRIHLLGSGSLSAEFAAGWDLWPR